MRRFHRTASTIVALLALACSREPASKPAAASPKPSPIEGLPITLTVKQRTTTAIPGAGDRVSISIEDITRGQVMVSVVRTPAPQGSSALLGPLSMKPGEASTFHFDEFDFLLELKQLDNALIGTDHATFAVNVAPQGKPALSEAQKIERLIESVAALQGATFLRNGDEHTASDAADHLRRKLGAGGDDLATAELFIEHAATKSSLSGKDYEIRFADGRTVRLADFLREQLAKLD